MAEIQKQILLECMDNSSLKEIISEAIAPLVKQIELINGAKTFTTVEVAALLKKDHRTIIRYCKDKIIKASKVGGAWVITPDNLDAYINPKITKK